jgi:hypothetical protein
MRSVDSERHGWEDPDDDEGHGRARNELKKRAPDGSVVNRFLETK